MKFKERLIEISNNFNGNHNRTIKDLEEVIDNLKDSQNEKRKANNIKLAYIILIGVVIVVLVSGAINYNINGQSRLSVGVNESTIERLLIENDAKYVDISSMGLTEVDLTHKKYVDDRFGHGYESFISLEETTNSQTTFISKVNGTTQLKQPGLYRIAYSAEITHDFKLEDINVKFLINNISIHQHNNGEDYLQIYDIKSDKWLPIYEIYYYNLTSQDTIDLNLMFSTSNDMARMSNAIIEIWRVEE